MRAPCRKSDANPQQERQDPHMMPLRGIHGRACEHIRALDRGGHSRIVVVETRSGQASMQNAPCAAENCPHSLPAMTRVALPRKTVASRPAGPAVLARQWHDEPGGFVWLDSATADGASTSVLAKNPMWVLRGNVHCDAAMLREAIRRGAREDPAGGLFGWVRFDGQFTFGYHD